MNSTNLTSLSPQARWHLIGLQRDFSCPEESTEAAAMKELLNAELVVVTRGFLAGSKYYTITQKGREAEL
jgi:hypothetical protein